MKKIVVLLVAMFVLTSCGEKSQIDVFKDAISDTVNDYINCKITEDELRNRVTEIDNRIQKYSASCEDSMEKIDCLNISNTITYVLLHSGNVEELKEDLDRLD